MAKKLSLDELLQKANEKGLAALTTRQLEILSTSGRINPDDVRQALDLRLKVTRIEKANRPVGRPTLRSKNNNVTTNEQWVKAQEDRILNLSDDEAQAELTKLMSPVQNDLLLITRLQKIVADGGKAGSDAARLIVEMQKRYLAPIKRTVNVTIQTAG